LGHSAILNPLTAIARIQKFATIKTATPGAECRQARNLQAKNIPTNNNVAIAKRYPSTRRDVPDRPARHREK
jgi:hypothetical protein